MIDPREFAQMDAIAHQYYDQTHPQMPTATAKKPSGNLLTHLLPTIGGTAGGVGGGALGGAVAGTAILPGVGTVAGGILGALLGGAAGGAAGKVVENKAEHQALGNDVLKEAGINGVLSAGPLRLAKFGYGTLRGLSTVGREGAPIVQTLEASRGIPVKDVSSTTRGTAGAVLPKTPVAKATPTKPMNPIDFTAQFKPGAQELTKKIPSVSNTFMQTGTHDPLTLISQHLATNATKGETRQIVNGLFPQGLDSNTRNVLIKKLQIAKTPEEVNQLLDSTHQALTNVPSGAIAPKAIKVNFGEDATSSSSVLPAKQQPLIENIVPGKKLTLADAITNAGDRANKPLLQNTARNLVTQGEAAQGRVAGVSAGSKIAGKELTPQDTSKMLQTLQREGIKTGNANNSLRDIQDKLNGYGQAIGEHFTNNNAPLASTDVSTLAGKYLKGLKTSDPTINSQANILATDLKNNVKDTKGLWEFRKNLDSMIPDAKQGADNTGAAKLIALKNMRQFITKQLGDVPGASNYHDLSEIKPFISAEAKRLNNPGGGIVGRLAASGPAQKGEQLLGKAAQKVGTAAGGAPTEGVRGLTPGAIASRTVPVGLAQAFGAQNPSMATSSQMPNTQATNSNMDAGYNNPTDLSSALMAAQQASASPYSQENLVADIQRDPKHASNYIDTYKSLDAIFNPQTTASSKNTVKPSNQQYFLAQGGVNALQQLSQMLQSDPSLIERNATPGQGLPLVGSLISNTSGASGYHALADQVLQNLIHLQTGATATPEEIKAAKGQLPQPGDPPGVQQQKLNNLMAQFQTLTQSQNVGASNNQSSLLDALMSAGYGQ